MCVYLEELFPEKPLLGTTALEKAQVISWDHKIFNMLMTPVAEALRNRGSNFVNRALPGPLDVPQIAELAERGKMRLDFAWPTLSVSWDCTSGPFIGHPLARSIRVMQRLAAL